MRAIRFSPIFFCWLVVFLAISSLAQSVPSQPAVNLDTIDKTVDPCVDFFQYACGNWLKTAEIPADQASWGQAVELRERNASILREILEKAAVDTPVRDAITRKIGDYYSSCMDEKTVEARGLQPLKPELDRIAAVKDKAALIEAIARVHLIGPNPLFNFYSSSDLHNANQVIAYIDQGGLSLPDRDYYLKDDPKMAAARESLVEYATQLFTLIGQRAARWPVNLRRRRRTRPRRYCALRPPWPKPPWTAPRAATPGTAIIK